MKITIKNKKPEVKKTFIEDVPVGYVFEMNDYCKNSTKVLKLCNDKIVLLTFNNGDDWFLLDDDSWKDTPIKILGEITEIIVEETE